MGRTISSEAQHARMMNQPIPPLVLSICLPTVLSQLISVIYNTADTWYVSQISTEASAAVGIVFSLMAIIQALGFGLSMGAGSLISRRLGEKRNEEAHKYASSAFAAALLCGTVIAILGLTFLEPLMRLLGSTPTILPYACDYARYILICAPIMCASFVLSGTLRSEGESDLAMWGLCSGGILNLILDPVLIFVLKMGIAGAAIATGISQTVSFTILLSAFLRGKSIVKLSIKHISKSIKDYGLILSTGLPTIFRQGLASLASATLNIQASAYGDAAVAGMTIANKVYILMRNITVGIGQGFSAVAGYNFGAGNKKRVKQAFKFTCLLGTCVCITVAIVVALIPENIMGWFRDDPAVIEAGKNALLFCCAVMPFMAYSTYVNQLLQGLGFKTRATILASSRQGIFYLPLIYILPHYLGFTGVQLTQPMADMLTLLVAVPFQIHFFKKYLKESEE